MAVTKNICHVKGEDAVDHSKVTRSFEKFCLGCENLVDQVRLGEPKTMDSKVVLQAIVLNEYQGKLIIAWSSVVCHLHSFNKSIQSCQIVPMLLKYCKIFNSL